MQAKSRRHPAQKQSSPPLKASSPLPPQRAFVVQFQHEADPEQGQWSGRIEHVHSGQATHFHSLAELSTFIGHVLREVGVRSGDDSDDSGVPH